MNRPRHNPLADEVMLYRGAAEARQGWRNVLLATVLTLGIFLVLPFSDIIKAVPEKDLEIRTVDTAPAAVSPPAPPQPPRLPAGTGERMPQARPTLVIPEARRGGPVKTRPSLCLPSGGVPGDVLVAAGGNLVRGLPSIANGASLGTGFVGDPGFGMDVGLHFDVETVPSGQAEPRTGASEPLVFEVEELDRAPRPTLQIPPVYPYRARARNIEGYVDLLFTLTAEGRVTGVTVLETMPGDVFVDAAVRAVEAWRFEPGTKGGKPVAVRMKVKLRFELD